MPPQLIHMGVNFMLQHHLGPKRKVRTNLQPPAPASSIVVVFGCV